MGEPTPRTMTTLPRKVGLAGLLLLAVGCTADSSRDVRRDDPILGIGASPNNQPASVATSVPVPNTQGPTTQGPPTPAYRPQPPLTAMPTSGSANNNGYQPLQGGSDMRIGSPAPPANGGWTPTQNTQPVAGVTPVPPPGAPAPAPATPVGMTAPPGNLDQAYAAVMDRKPLWHKMTFNSQTGEYTFQMSVPSKLNTAASQNVEASAATQTDAIRRTLEQLAN